MGRRRARRGGGVVALQASPSSFGAAQEAGDVLRHLDLESTLLSIQNAALDLLGADIVGILLVDQDGEEVLRMRACAGHRTPHTALLEVRRDQGVAGKVFATGRAPRGGDYLSGTTNPPPFFS